MDEIQKTQSELLRVKEPKPITEPQREVGIISSERAADDIRRTKRELDRRFAEDKAHEERRKAQAVDETTRRAEQNKQAEGVISTQQASALFGGDLSQFKADESGNLTPITPQATEKLQRRRKIQREYGNAIHSIQGLRRTKATAPLLDNVARLLEERRRLFEDLT